MSIRNPSTRENGTRDEQHKHHFVDLWAALSLCLWQPYQTIKSRFWIRPRTRPLQFIFNRCDQFITCRGFTVVRYLSALLASVPGTINCFFNLLILYKADNKFVIRTIVSFLNVVFSPKHFRRFKNFLMFWCPEANYCNFKTSSNFRHFT